MRLTPISIAFMLLVACSPEPEPAQDGTGWSSYIGPAGPRATYKFGDRADTMFGGACHEGPVFLLSGGDYPARTTTFELKIDGQKWNLDAFADHHGRAFIIEDPSIIQAFAKANKEISFRVGDWNRTVPPSALISRFIEDCRALRARPETSK